MTTVILIAALILDAAFGEPKWLWSRLPHPAVLMGRAVAWFDEQFNTAPMARLKGIASLVALGIAAILLGLVPSLFPGGWILEILITAILLAQNSLALHVSAVANALRLSVGDGRHAVAQIVGRDTESMDQPAIARAAIESAAENLSDGVVAPAFWFLIGGLPGLLLYKTVNTADSMIGYRTARHRDFGWASARFDDVLNWAPARLTAALIAVTHGKFGHWKTIRCDAALHRSPNAGWPEAAMAQVLDISLAGPRSYSGQLQNFPFVHPKGRKDVNPTDIDSAVTALWRVWVTLLAGIVLIAAFL